MSTDVKTRMDFFVEMLRAGKFSRGALAIAFILLYRHLNGQTGRCDPSISTLAIGTGLSVRGVKKAIDEIKRSGWWRIGREGTAARGGRTNSYAPQFEVVNYTSPLGIESGERLDTSSTAKVVNAWTPLRHESGEQTGKKVVNARSPKPVRNQQLTLTLGRADGRLGVRSGYEAARSAFDEFWQTYPSRSPHSNPKEPARLKFEAALKLGVDPAVIIRGAENFAASVRVLGTERRYIAQAATWLHQKRWDDYLEAPRSELPRAGMI